MRSSDEAVAKARLTVRPFVLRLAPKATERLASFNFAERGGGDLRLIEKQGRGEWSFEGSGKVHLLARHDPTDVPFEMWTFSSAQIRVIWSCSARSRSASPWPARPSPRGSWKI